ncbi:hypothetical protein CEP54_010353 [Fusarium duplospermum]|uniref:D-lactate dehydratase n=1 Tax=Fusarium duplospermum TaxID=1325734 RepID=A0A428PKF5_9HYPO|nr:hypothetical protein CEP54_010353 [Fusarium duplospermum]
MSTRQKLLVVLTSQDVLPTRANMKTGWYLPELVHPYNNLAPHVDIVVASPKGGEAPVDPYSIEDAKDDEASMFDLAIDGTSHALIREFYESDKLVSAVCHGPAALANVELTDGTYMIEGQTVTGFSNAEEEAYKFTDAMPFLLEDKLQEHGGKYKKADQLFGVKVVTSGKSENLITGQNPPSAGVIGKVLLEAIRSRAS